VPHGNIRPVERDRNGAAEINTKSYGLYSCSYLLTYLRVYVMASASVLLCGGAFGQVLPGRAITGLKANFPTDTSWTTYSIHRVSNNVPRLACLYNFDTRERILIFLTEMLPIK